MLSYDTRKKLENIVRGKVIEGKVDTCTSIRNDLCASFSTSRTVKTDFEGQSIVKEKQVKALKAFADKHHLWVTDLPEESQYLTHGGEAKVYLDKDDKNVIKLNDTVYYATWLEYFNSLVIHNLLFPDTAYTFLGFTEKGDCLLAVLKQPYISSDGIAGLDNIKQLLSFNGFENTRRHDYFNTMFELFFHRLLFKITEGYYMGALKCTFSSPYCFIISAGTPSHLLGLLPT
jgi:hypothetical protein